MPTKDDPAADDSAFFVDDNEHSVKSKDFQHRFYFDQAFRQDTSQQQVYDDVALPLVNDVLQGYHGTILAYGQTGGGKTYCMFGPQGPHPAALQGVVPRAARRIFEGVCTGPDCSGVFVIECDFLEVYCETIRDLLTPGNNKLQVKEMPNKGFCVDGLTRKAVASMGEVLQILKIGLRHRAAANTRLNQHSSRSHAIFTLHVLQQTCHDTVRQSKLTFVDLAGSEKVAKSGSSGEMLEEAKKINTSLSALGHVIDALAEKRPHVPYRDSRLTRILENSLGGNCRTTLLVACSPSSAHSVESLSALRFAARAKKVCNMVCLRKAESNADDRRLMDRICTLREELARAHQMLEQRVDVAGKVDTGAPHSARSPRNSTSHRSLHTLRRTVPISDSGGTGSTPALLEEPQMHHRVSARSGASHEDHSETEPKCLPPLAYTSMEQDFHLAHSAMPSPLIGSDSAASTAIGSASSSSVAATPLSSRRDADLDDMAGRRLHWGRNTQRPAAVITDLAEVLAQNGQEPPKEQECPTDDCAGDVHIQQELNWKLEMERHRSAALSFELNQRTRESEDLRKQLEEAETKAEIQSRTQLNASESTPVLVRAGCSMPSLHVPMPTTIHVVDQPQLGQVPLHTMQLSTNVIALPQSPVVCGTQQGQIVSTTRTPSSSPLRVQRASYCSGLHRAAATAASAEGPPPWASPRQSITHRMPTPLKRSSSTTCSRLYTTAVPPVTGATVTVSHRGHPPLAPVPHA
jgi:hypothetical protein